LAWFGAAGRHHQRHEPLRLAVQAAPCGLRKLATETLDAAGIAWSEVFVGGGVATIAAAASAGLAVAALLKRVAPVELEPVGAHLSLPPLPSAEIIFHSRISDKPLRAALQNFLAAFRAYSAG
jgi:DNA-binding transcriptional LysR family regulator